MKIKLKNFQSLKNEEIDINPGLTLITGPTNNGKTAIFRALFSLLTNPAKAPKYINGVALKQKEDTDFCVRIEDDDIPDIEFHRSKTKAWYMIDNKKYSKLARSNIFDILPEMHKKFVYSPEDPRKILNFQTEKNLAFPFDRSDTEMFKLFERIFNITDTRVVTDTMKKEEAEINFKISQCNAEKSRILEELTNIKNTLGKTNKELLLNYISQYKNSSYIVQRYEGELQKIISYVPFLKEINNLPQITSISGETYDAVTVLEKKLREVSLKMNYIKNYTEVQMTEINSDLISSILSMKDKITQISCIEQKLKEQETVLKSEESILNQCQRVIESFDVCPLCGNKLGEKE